jgi:cysteine-rich repeat protein
MPRFVSALHPRVRLLYILCLLLLVTPGANTHAQTVVGTSIATTTIRVSICGDELVNDGEECDVLGETGAYSTTIAGRQCDEECQYGPYCGDSILQTLFDEQCDDGNNIDGDFCAADCTVEFPGTGGGNPGSGGSGGGGGSDSDMGDTRISIQGKAYPNVTVNILIDGETVGTVRTNSTADFTFNTDTEPGTASVSFWANDSRGTRSYTVNTTFDITQGAVTNLNGIYLPPTIRTSNANPNPGDVIVLSGQTIPNARVEVSIDNGSPTLTATADASGLWSLNFDTRTVSVNTHTVKARFITGSGALEIQSPYGTSLSLFVGVEGKATSNSDLNRDGKVNLIDFSILIFWWGTSGGNSNPPADISQNARVGLEDFSILLFNWTG